MQFQEFKKEVIRRVKSAKCYREEVSNLVQVNDFSEVFEIINDKFKWYMNNEFISMDILKNIDPEILEQNEIFINKSSDKGFILCDDGEVEASGDVMVVARKNVKVSAFDRVRVMARDNVKVWTWHCSWVEAYNNSEVTAWGESKVEAWNNSKVVALDRTRVVAWGRSEIKACDNAVVEAWNKSTVIAEGDVYLSSFNGTNHTLKDSAIMRHEGTIYFPKDLKFKQI